MTDQTANHPPICKRWLERIQPVWENMHLQTRPKGQGGRQTDTGRDKDRKHCLPSSLSPEGKHFSKVCKPLPTLLRLWKKSRNQLLWTALV